MKKFTLIELIVAIVTLGIIAAIIVVNIANFRKEAITSSISQNVSILQTAMDTYFIKNDKYPDYITENLTLERPQLINTDLLKKEGYLKENIETAKIPEAFYWLDSFGKVWGSTSNGPDSVNLLSSNDGDSLEVLSSERGRGFVLYETKGYISKLGEDQTLSASIEKGDKYYKSIQEGEYEGSNYFTIPVKGEASYLFSEVDEYGLETAPFGKFHNAKKTPILKGDGTYYFEIENLDVMYWINFAPEQETPGGSSITYKFKVQDENGEYMEWVDDFYSLPNSTGIKVEVVMKSDSDGNSPILYDLNIMFKYLEELDTPILNSPVASDKSICPENPFTSTLNYYGEGAVDDVGTLTYSFKSGQNTTLGKVIAPSVSLHGKYKVLEKTYYVLDKNTNTYEVVTSKNKMLDNDCMVIIYKVKIYETYVDNINREKDIQCLANVSHSKWLDNSNYMSVYYFSLGDNDLLSKLNVNINTNLWTLKKIEVQYAVDGGAYKTAKSITEIPKNACVSVIYYLTLKNNYTGTPPVPPTLEICKEDNCVPPVCEDNCFKESEVCVTDCTTPKDYCDLNPTHKNCKDYCIETDAGCVAPPCTTDCSVGLPADPDNNDPEWITVDTVRYIGSGAVGQQTYWYGFEATDSLTQNDTTKNLTDTRVVYNFAYGNGAYWSSLTDKFEPKNSTGIYALALIQVRRSELDKIDPSEYVESIGVKFLSSQGAKSLSAMQPTLTIVADKDNNGTRNVYSDKSNIDWSVQAVDPKGRDIIETEWRFEGLSATQLTPKRNYAVGTYLIEARVKNSLQIWSEWTPFELKVLPELPVAVITKTPSYVEVSSVVSLKDEESYDQDGDRLVKAEWKGDYKEKYAAGQYKVGLRVQDEEGYWSEWTELNFTVHEKDIVIHKVELEDAGYRNMTSRDGRILSDPSYSGSGYLNGSMYLGHYGISPKANGVNILGKAQRAGEVFADELKLKIGVYALDETKYDVIRLGEVVKVRGLKPEDVLTVAGEVNIDYIEVVDPNDKVYSDISINLLDTNGNIASQQLENVSSERGYSLDVTYLNENDSKMTMEVKQGSNVMKVLFKDQFRDGGSRNKFKQHYDLTDSTNTPLKSGSYELVFTFIGVTGTKTVITKPFSIQNTSKIARIEAELSHLKKSTNSNSTTTNVAYSNGVALRMPGASYYLEYSFEGSGFEINFPFADDMELYIDGNYIETISPGKMSYNLLYSKSGLSEGTHTLRLKGITGASAEVDYIDIFSSVDEVVPQDVFRTATGSEEIVMYNLQNNYLDHSVGMKMYFEYKAYKEFYETLEVVDSNNKVVKTINKNFLRKVGASQLFSHYWDGKLDNGQYASDGKYRFKLTTVGVGGSKKETYSTPFEIAVNKDKTKVESTDKLNGIATISGNYGSWNEREGDNFSGDTSARIAGSAYSYTFQFTGTGFDIFLNKGYDISFIVDGVTYGSGLKKVIKDYQYSMHDLNYGTHTVTVKGSSEVLVDYMNLIQ